MSPKHSHTFGWRNLATNCYPLRSSQGVGAEWHDGSDRVRNYVPLSSCALPFLSAARMLGLMLAYVFRHDAGNIKYRLALSRLASLLIEGGLGTARFFSPRVAALVSSRPCGYPVGTIAQRHHGRAGEVSCRRGLKICRLSEEVAGWLSCRHDRASLFLLLALINNYLLEYCGRRQASRAGLSVVGMTRAGPAHRAPSYSCETPNAVMYWFITSCTRAVANMPIRRLSNIGKDRVGLLIPAPQVLKKKKSSTRRRVGTAHGSTALQLLSGAKGAIINGVSAPLRSGWPKL